MFKTSNFFQVVIVDAGSLDSVLCWAYCQGKSFLFNMFFGFRNCNKNDVELFLIPLKDYKELMKIKNLLIER